MKYDRELAIKNATNLFWKLGFQATKMRDLQDELDMRPGSIYAAFGNKETLFEECLKAYSNYSSTQLCDYSARFENPITALYEFIKDVAINEKEGEVKNCFLVKSISELDGNNANLRQLAQKGVQEIEEGFAALFKTAQQQGLIKAESNPQRLAKWMQIQVMGLRSYSNSQDEPDDVNEMLDEIFNSFKQAHQPA